MAEITIFIAKIDINVKNCYFYFEFLPLTRVYYVNDNFRPKK